MKIIDNPRPEWQFHLNDNLLERYGSIQVQVGFLGRSKPLSMSAYEVTSTSCVVEAAMPPDSTRWWALFLNTFATKPRTHRQAVIMHFNFFWSVAKMFVFQRLVMSKGLLLDDVYIGLHLWMFNCTHMFLVTSWISTRPIRVMFSYLLLCRDSNVNDATCCTRLLKLELFFALHIIVKK